MFLSCLRSLCVHYCTQILTSHLAELLEQRFGPLVDAKRLSELLYQVIDCSEIFGAKQRKYVDQERFMMLLLEERRRRAAEAGETFGAGAGSGFPLGKFWVAGAATQPVSPSEKQPPRRGLSLDRQLDRVMESVRAADGKGPVPAASGSAVAVTSWPILNALKLIQKVYQDKIKADAADDLLSNPRQNLQEYMRDWLINQCVPCS